MLLRSVRLALCAALVSSDPSSLRGGEQEEPRVLEEKQQDNPPNVVIILIDDLGWNQVGYHAKRSGNNEIQTPNIDHYALSGIELNRGYMTQWCGPSRAALMTGRTNVYNANISSLISTFDDDIGYVAGLPPGTTTIATAFKTYGASIDKPYSAYFNGKWGIGVSSSSCCCCCCCAKYRCAV